MKRRELQHRASPWAAMMVFACSLISSVLTSSGVQAQGQSSDAWTLTVEHARCLLNRLDHYIESGDDPIVILLGRDCRAADTEAIPLEPRAELGAETKDAKTSFRQVPIFEVVPVGKPIPTVVYRQRQLACLKSFILEESVGLVLVPRKPCATDD